MEEKEKSFSVAGSPYVLASPFERDGQRPKSEQIDTKTLSDRADSVPSGSTTSLSPMNRSRSQVTLSFSLERASEKGREKAKEKGKEPEKENLKGEEEQREKKNGEEKKKFLSPSPVEKGEEKKRFSYQASADTSRVISTFLMQNRCFDLLPQSGKVIVLDINLGVKHAFRALKQNNFFAALLWDSKKSVFTGLLTVMDLIHIVLRCHSLSEEIIRTYCLEKEERREQGEQEGEEDWLSDEEELDFQQVQKATFLFNSCKIRHLKSMSKVTSCFDSLVAASPEDSITTICSLLFEHQLHGVPLVEGNTALSVVTSFRILQYFAYNLESKPDFMNSTLPKLGIGTYHQILTILRETPLIVVLDVLVRRELTSVPVVDDRGVVVDVFTQDDVLSLGCWPDLFDFMEEPLHDVISLIERDGIQRHPVPTCLRTETLETIVYRLLTNPGGQRFLVCVDGEGHIEGIVSVSDILRFLYEIFISKKKS